jgi:hypothetical protein
LYAQICEEQALSFDAKKVHTPTIEKVITIYATNKDVQRAKGKKLHLTKPLQIQFTIFIDIFDFHR